MNTIRIEFAPGHEDEAITEQDVAAARRVVGLAPRMLAALRRTESNLSRLIAAKHSDEVLMTPWRDEVRALIAEAEGRSLQEQSS